MPQFIPPDLSVPRGYPTGNRALQPIEAENVRSYAEAMGRLERAISAVSARIDINPASRVARWLAAVGHLEDAGGQEVLEQLVQTIQADGGMNHPYRRSFLALTESRCFIAIVEKLIDHLSEAHLRELVKGHDDPASDQQSSRARNKEFELFVAAAFLHGGLPVALAEPDVLIKVGGEVRALAVKRIWSRNKATENIASASRQILKNGYPGYIVLDITRYLNPDLHFIEHWRHLGEAQELRMNSFARKPIVTQRRNRLVEGVFLRSAFPLISPGPAFGTYERWVGAAVSGGNRDEHMTLLLALLPAIRNF